MSDIKPKDDLISENILQLVCPYNADGEEDGVGDAADEEDDAPEERVAELDLGEVGESGLDALGHVADVHEEEEARDEEGRPEGEAEQAAPAEDVDDAADQGEDHLPRLRHARRGLDEVRVPGQSHDVVVISRLKCSKHLILYIATTSLILIVTSWSGNPGSRCHFLIATILP